MNSECLRIADQLRRAFAGKAWHGPPLREILAGVTAEQANRRAPGMAHSIWELVLHIDVYVRIALEATQGKEMPTVYASGADWFSVLDASPEAWAMATRRLFENGELFAQAIDGFADARLQETVPGRDYDFYYLFHGIVQHSLYHGGQIAMLKRAFSGDWSP